MEEHYRKQDLAVEILHTLLKATGKPIESLSQNIGAREKEKKRFINNAIRC
jgi:hypothetical protein